MIDVGEGGALMVLSSGAVGGGGSWRGGDDGGGVAIDVGEGGWKSIDDGVFRELASPACSDMGVDSVAADAMVGARMAAKLAAKRAEIFFIRFLLMGDW